MPTQNFLGECDEIAVAAQSAHGFSRIESWWGWVFCVQLPSSSRSWQWAEAAVAAEEAAVAVANACLRQWTRHVEKLKLCLADLDPACGDRICYAHCAFDV